MAKKAGEKKESQTGKIAAVLAKYDNPSTSAGYKNAIESFLRCMNGLPKKDADGRKAVYDYEAPLDAYLTDTRDTSVDFIAFADCLRMESTSALSARQIMTFARKFLTRFGVVVDQNDVQDIKRKMKGSAATINKSMSARVIEKALTEIDVRGRALVLTLASSGMRLNEALSLTMSDIDFETSPVTVYIRGENTKTQTTRYTFISNEAALCIKAWLKKRPEYLKGAAGRNKGLVAADKSAPKDSHSDLMFPFSDNVANLTWENALKASGQFSVDDRTGRNQLRIHSFRAFFITQLSMAGQKILAESLAGHSGYLDGAYRQISLEQAAGLYKSVMHVVTIGIPQEFREKANELNGKLQLQGESIEGLRAKNEKLERQLTAMTEKLTAVEETQNLLQKVFSSLTPEELVTLQKKIQNK